MATTPPAASDTPRLSGPASPFSATLWRRGAAVLLVIISITAYLPALQGGFIWDDWEFIVQNRAVQRFDGLSDIWFAPGVDSPEDHYWPITYSTFWLEARLFGDNPFGYHLVNVLVHAINALLVWVLLRRSQFPGAWLAAAIFAVHPVHVESVAWIIERKDVLSTLFYLLAFLAYTRFVDSRRWSVYAAVVLLFTAAMLSKSMAVTLPIALAVWLWYTHDRLRAADLWPLVFLVVIAGGLTALDLWCVARSARPAEFTTPLIDRPIIAGRAVWFYLSTLAWPLGLTSTYPRWEIDPASIAQWIYPAGAVALLLLLAAFRRRLGKGPLAAMVYFYLTLGPVLGFVQHGFMGMSYVADRFQYLASIGVIALAAALLTRAARHLRMRWPIAAGLTAMLLLALGTSTWGYSRLYRNAEAFWRYNVEKNPESGVAHNNLGEYLLKQGRVDEALALLRRAEQLGPVGPAVHCNLGGVLKRQGQYDQAIHHYRRALEEAPDMVEARFNLASVLARKGNLGQAVLEFNKGLKTKPDDVHARLELTALLMQMGRHADAMREARTAVEQAPDSWQAHDLLGVSLARQRQLAPALTHLKRAVELAPDAAKAHHDLGVALKMTGRADEAASQYTKALELDPGYADAHYSMGVLLAQAGKTQASIRHFEAAVRAQPNHVNALTALGLTLLRAGRPDEARTHLEQVLRLQPDHPQAQKALRAIRAGRSTSG